MSLHAGGCPLDTTLHCYSDLDRAKQFINAIIPYADRWKHIVFVGSMTLLAGIEAVQHFQCLESLSLKLCLGKLTEPINAFDAILHLCSLQSSPRT